MTQTMKIWEVSRRRLENSKPGYVLLKLTEGLSIGLLQYARNDRVEQKENKEAITMPPAWARVIDSYRLHIHGGHEGGRIHNAALSCGAGKKINWA